MLPRLGLPALIIDVARDVPSWKTRRAAGQRAAAPPAAASCSPRSSRRDRDRLHPDGRGPQFHRASLREAAERHFTIERLAADDALVCGAVRGLTGPAHRPRAHELIGRAALRSSAAAPWPASLRASWLPPADGRIDDLDHERYARFGGKVVSVTEREGLHTLDAIVLADDAPEIRTADTHGATELVFAAFDLPAAASSPPRRHR